MHSKFQKMQNNISTSPVKLVYFLCMTWYIKYNFATHKTAHHKIRFCLTKSKASFSEKHQGPLEPRYFSDANYLRWVMDVSLRPMDFGNMVMSSNGNIFHITGPLCGEFTGHRWIPLTKTSDAELWCFPSSAPEESVEQTMEAPVIWDAIALIMTSL